MVDFTNPTGEVVKKNGKLLKNIPIIQDTSILASELTLVKHSNNKDWWLLVPKLYDDKIIKFLFTDDEIKGPMYQKIGPYNNKEGDGGGSACFSPDGTKYVRFNSKGGFHVFNFNRTNGELSNYKYALFDVNGIFAGVSISPNSKYAYLSAHDALFQVDLDVDDLGNNLVLIDSFNWKGSPKPPFFATFNYSQLGPDCRIYIGSGNGINQLNVILYPDRAGKACTLVQQGLTLATYTSGSMPYFPTCSLSMDNELISLRSFSLLLKDLLMVTVVR